MSQLRRLLKNINIINILLTGILIFFIFYIVLPSYKIDYSHILSVSRESTVNDVAEEEEPTEEESSVSSDYLIIAEKNLFHPERKIPLAGKDAQPIQKPVFVLYGTLITDDVKLAFLDDQKSVYSTPGRGKRQRILHLGEELSGYTLSEIYNEKVVMVRGDDRIEVKVVAVEKQKLRKTDTVTPQKTEELREQKAGDKAVKPRARDIKEGG